MSNQLMDRFKEVTNMLKNEKCTYETPKIEIIIFDLKEAIATSGDFGSGMICGEEIYE
jgi:hypothetical protein